MKHQSTEFDLSHYEISGRHDVRPLVINTLMTYLQLARILETTGPFYTAYQFKPMRPSKAILAAYPPNSADFLKSLF